MIQEWKLEGKGEAEIEAAGEREWVKYLSIGDFACFRKLNKTVF